MGKRDERIDAYIEKSADFAKPILRHLRELIHEACPQVEETWKWSFPHFDYKGGILCSMAAFKQHCAFGFWKASLMTDADKLLNRGSEAMGQLGQIKSLEDLPPDDTLLAYIKEAARLNEENVKLPAARAQTAEKKEIVVPDYFSEALRKNQKASETFANFSYSNKKEYIYWIAEAKSEETRNKRLATAIEWMNEGKTKNWKYEKR